MTRFLFLSIALASVAGCNTTTMGGGGVSGGPGLAERLVVGGAMSFEDCRTRGGLIIHDQGSAMIMCDPTVLGPVVPVDEFAHPAA